MAETDINSVERSRSAEVTEVRKPFPLESTAQSYILKSPWSKNLEEFKTLNIKVPRILYSLQRKSDV